MDGFDRRDEILVHFFGIQRQAWVHKQNAVPFYTHTRLVRNTDDIRRSYRPVCHTSDGTGTLIPVMLLKALLSVLRTRTKARRHPRPIQHSQ